MESQTIHQNRIRQTFFLLAIVAWGALLVLHLASFLPALLGAITLYTITRKSMIYLTEVRKWKRGLAASLLMILTFLIILIPVFVLVQMLMSKVSYAIDHSNELVNSLKVVIGNLENQTGIKLLTDDNINQLGNFIAKTAPEILNATFNTLVTMFFMYFILYFLLVNSRKLERGIYEHLPLKNENVTLMGKEMKNIIMSNAIGIPVIAFLQGVVGLIGYYILGVGEPWFWFVVTCISAMLPVVGAAFAFVPVAIIFFAKGDTTQGIIMLVYGFGVIGLVDNLFRLSLAKRIGDVHPLITIFGVIIGIKLFGFVGLIFGPLLISMFLLLIRIYASEFNSERKPPPSKTKAAESET